MLGDKKKCEIFYTTKIENWIFEINKINCQNKYKQKNVYGNKFVLPVEKQKKQSSWYQSF